MRQPQPIVHDLPAGIPMLCSGAHDAPEHGACFMEYASVLAGERFSDHPHCTHPVLAAACRAINDHISDGARQRLVGYVPEVIGTATHDPHVSAALTLLCADAAEPSAPGRFVLARSVALQRLQGLTGGRWARFRVRCTERDYAAAATKVVGEAVSTIAPHGGDRALHQLLVDLLECYRTTANAGQPNQALPSDTGAQASEVRR
jgi:hypothetical protein